MKTKLVALGDRERRAFVVSWVVEQVGAPQRRRRRVRAVRSHRAYQSSLATALSLNLAHPNSLVHARRSLREMARPAHFRVLAAKTRRVEAGAVWIEAPADGRRVASETV